MITLDKEVSGILHVQEQRLQHLTWPIGQIFLGKSRFAGVPCPVRAINFTNHKHSTENAKGIGRLCLLSGT